MIPRCSFLFENPNMAAVLFVELALVGWALRVRFPRTGSALIFLASVAVVLTGSRGGLVALLAGLLVSFFGGGVWRRVRAIPAGVRVRAALALVLLVVLVVAGGLGGRLCSVRRDESVAQRLILWRSVPRMMADAPGGWGLGCSGAAFVDWYQPLDRHEEYRTMVGSHQTLLVEFGTIGRIAYVFVWLLALTLAFRHAKATGRTHAAAQVTALAVAATFSSVHEVWALGLVPALSLLPAARDVLARRLGLGGWAGLLACSLVPILWVGACCGSGDRRFENEGRVSRSVDAGADAVRWLVPDVRVTGVHAPRLLRSSGSRISVAASPELVAADAEELVFCGATCRVARGRFPRLRRIVYLAPRFRPLVCDPSFERIVVGEFAAEVPDPVPEGVSVVPGAADYLGHVLESVGSGPQSGAGG